MSATNRGQTIKGVETKSVTKRSLEGPSSFLELRLASLKFWSFATDQINLTFQLKAQTILSNLRIDIKCGLQIILTNH
jgi:hypothetical protein